MFFMQLLIEAGEPAFVSFCRCSLRRRVVNPSHLFQRRDLELSFTQLARDLFITRVFG